MSTLTTPPETTPPGALGTRRTIKADGADISVAVAGDGPLVILMHGWPELGLSWRHQIPALTAAGWQVATPDMRGYGASGKPEDPAAYTLNTIARDMGAVAAALGARKWVSVGHDWGALAAWRCALYYPEQVAAVCGMSVPHAAPSPMTMLQMLDHLYPDRFFYIRYFQEIGVGEAELAANPTAALKQIFYSASAAGVRAHTPRRTPRDAKLLEAWDAPPEAELPFLPNHELADYAAAFTAGGWRGPLNWYRNFDQNAADARALGDNIIRQPSAFLAGELDPVLHFWPGQLEHMRAHLADLRLEVRPPAAGHWLQQESPAETNTALLEFLSAVRPLLAG
jgi:pimeloyl-ACP methyl ester carboxylesterase